MPSSMLANKALPKAAFMSLPASTFEPSRDQRSSFLSVLIPALMTGGLLYLGYFPVAWGWLGWVALAPLLCLVRSRAKARWIYLGAWAGGLAFYGPVLQWLRVADPMMYFTWGIVATYCALYFPLGLFLIRTLDRRTPLPLVLTVPLVWTALEFLRAHLITGFAWYFLGHTQHDFLRIIQISDLAGAYAVTFLVAAVNALLFEALFTWGGFRRSVCLPISSNPAAPWTILLKAAVVGLLVAGTLAYGTFRIHQTDFDAGPRIALIQGNLGQGIRNLKDAPDEEDRNQAAQIINAHYGSLKKLAERFHPDLIVFPETSCSKDWEELSSDYPMEDIHISGEVGGDKNPIQSAAREWRMLVLKHINAEFLTSAKESGTKVLFGLNSYIQEKNGSHRYNSAVLVDGRGEPAGRYDKIHRVPFGEYVPLKDSLPFMNWFSPYDFDYSVRHGENLTRFPLMDRHFGVVICFEDTDPTLARQYVAPGHGTGCRFLLEHLQRRLVPGNERTR